MRLNGSEAADLLETLVVWFYFPTVLPTYVQLRWDHQDQLGTMESNDRDDRVGAQE